ncbi:MAG: 2-succinyl-5-enolpyruvyl-6-hydroxy-3-cyclohexene-1-carboxylic-acid synthase [Micrococcales bacterium]|nr:2-succinyl-5-enolpyruvyl-6-hydroxy-3-cyclohexene-1-carboxylic-acid synthase [Micrococcales bacterium]
MSEPNVQCPAVASARVLLQALGALGLRDVVLCPGSRSGPLAFALADAALEDHERPSQVPPINLYVRVDERAAAFLALGLAKGLQADEDMRPVAVVTTSGTAVANLAPAVLEAHHSGVPLLVLSADRPHELRGVGANQVTDQTQVFGSATRLTVDVPAPTGGRDEPRDLRQLASRAVAAALGARTGWPGPVHLNLAYREPLVPNAVPWPEPGALGLTVVTARGSATADAVPQSAAAGPVHHVRDVPTVLLAGDGAGVIARQVAEANGWPLLAEPSSGARGGPNAIAAYRVLVELRDLGGAVRRVVVLGRPTLARPVQRMLAREAVEVDVIAPRGRDWTDAERCATQVLTEVPTRMRAGRAVSDAWLREWTGADDAAGEAIDEVLDEVEDSHSRNRRYHGARITGPFLARAVARASRPDDVLVAGASHPIRDLDLVARWEDSPLVLANRGLSGIDGTVSTTVGVSLAMPDRQVRALLGDLTFLHDVGGLLVPTHEIEPSVQLVVANDEGGSIFHSLEPGEDAYADVFERVFATPHEVDLRAVAEAYGMRYHLVDDAADLEPVLDSPAPGMSLVEVRVDREGRRELSLALATRTVEAIGLLNR